MTSISRMNASRTGPARAASRATHSRALETGSPARAAIAAGLRPATRIRRTHHNTSPDADRRAKHSTGSTTWVAWQPRHRVRRGRIRHRIATHPLSSPPASVFQRRTDRSRA
ncbi:hypothetical protein [Nonomuraea sp. NPDC049784]|uniref:hypothetical protein n=1 Tax=Nonomuraea sp. NPDC049784 TaxID=3154361 RepID=UPI003402AA26